MKYPRNPGHPKWSWDLLKWVADIKDYHINDPQKCWNLAKKMCSEWKQQYGSEVMKKAAAMKSTTSIREYEANLEAIKKLTK